MNRRLITALFISLLSLAAPAFAQDGETDDEAAAEKADDPEQQSAEDGPAEDSGEAAEEGEDEESADDGAESAEGEQPEATEGAETAQDAESGEQEEVYGPGGKPLRTDYPGTEESLKSRMDTNQLEGLDVDPNQPQAAYGLRIKELETKIDDLKEKVFQSKTRIVLLRETLLSGNLAGARAIIIHKTELGSAWKLQQAYYSLDGTKLMNRSNEKGELSDQRLFEVYDGSVAPGSHNLSILVKYQGTNVGLFPYFKGYEGDIKSSCEFNAQEGKIAQVKVRVIPVGGAAESIEKRPSVTCEVEYLENLRDTGTVAEDSDDGEEAQQEEPAKEAAEEQPAESE